MSKLELLIIGTIVGLFSSLIGGLFGAFLSYRFGIKKHLAIREIEKREEEERRNQELRKLLTDISEPAKHLFKLNNMLKKREFKELLARLNAEVFEFYREKVDRTLLTDSNSRHRLVRLAKQIEHFESLYEFYDRLNPFCYFIRGLDFLIISSYDTSLEALGRSKELGESELTHLTLTFYGHVDVNEIKNQLQRMLEDCDYYKALIESTLQQ